MMLLCYQFRGIGLRASKILLLLGLVVSSCNLVNCSYYKNDILILEAQDLPVDCTLVGAVSGRGVSVFQAEQKALFEAKYTAATHVVWQKTEYELGRIGVLGKSYRCKF